MLAAGEVATDAKYAAKAQSAAAATVADGTYSLPARRLALIGANGRQPGNMARDFERLVQKELGDQLVEPYEFEIPAFDAQTNTYVKRKHWLFFHMSCSHT